MIFEITTNFSDTVHNFENTSLLFTIAFNFCPHIFVIFNDKYVSTWRLYDDFLAKVSHYDKIASTGGCSVIGILRIEYLRQFSVLITIMCCATSAIGLITL